MISFMKISRAVAARASREKDFTDAGAAPADKTAHTISAA
jgi:hypothetical protein